MLWHRGQSNPARALWQHIYPESGGGEHEQYVLKDIAKPFSRGSDDPLPLGFYIFIKQALLYKNMQVHPETQAAWRAWLATHHVTEKEVFLVHNKKHTGKRAMSARQAMDEAICFGWIDTTVKSLDEDRYLQKFVRRTTKGKWSKNTLRYAKELIAQGKMTPAGMKMYKAGLQNPLADGGIPENPAVQPELKQALAKDTQAATFFENLAPSYKRQWLRWIESAKRPETRATRIATVVQKSHEQKKPWT